MGGAACHKLDAGWLVAKSGTGLGGGRPLLTARLNSLRPLCGVVSDSLKVLQGTAHDRRNVFEQLIDVVKYNSLGQISHALYDVGGEYRRNM